MGKAVLIGPTSLLRSIESLWKTRLTSVTISDDEKGAAEVTSEGAEKISELEQQLLDKQAIIDELSSTIEDLKKEKTQEEAKPKKQTKK